MSRTLEDFEATPDGPLGAPWLAWTASPPDITAGAAFGTGDATRSESIGPDSFCEAVLNTPMTIATAETFGVGIRLTAHSGAADGYMLDVTLDGGVFVPKLYKGSTFNVIATGAGVAEPIGGIRITVIGSAVTGYFQVDGVWTEVATATDTSYASVGYPGFWVQELNAAIGVDAVAWGDGDGILEPAANRFYRRLEPLAYDDEAQGWTLRSLAVALMAPREILEVSRQDERHAHPWGALLDPDYCPGPLLDWLAVFAGIEIPPSALTDSEKRYRIKQAAGRYRCTPQAVVEELQLVLAGAKTVLLGFHTPDQWHYTVGTLASETPDTAAVERATLAQKPVGMLVNAVVIDGWTWFVLAPTLIAHRELVEGIDRYVIDTPEYPTWQSVVDHFSTWQQLVDNDPDM